VQGFGVEELLISSLSVENMHQSLSANESLWFKLAIFGNN
jgi:hypothetical protein